MKNKPDGKSAAEGYRFGLGTLEVLDCRFNTGEGKSKRAARTNSGS